MRWLQYPLDTNCTYYIVGQPGKEILLHFEQFALSGNDGQECNDYLDVYDVFQKNGKEELHRKGNLKIRMPYMCSEFRTLLF